MGLYNSLDPKRFAEAHRRALARAGPVAYAFECNLAVFGFPFEKEMKTPVEVARWLVGTSSIGQGGDYIVKLATSGRFNLYPFPGGGFPPQMGNVIIATRKPDESISKTPEEVAGMLRDGKSCTMVFGLGPRGLPDEIMKMGDCHMDLTGKRISLETCTALGAAPARVMTHLENLSNFR